QHDLILAWIDKYGSITPAKMAGTAWNGGFFGSETPKRCRELWDRGLLRRDKEGKFKVFRRVEKEFAPVEIYQNRQLGIL
ncbi:MAG TPA: hypothetical protein VK255_03005, partial [Patescibacteria group bacterium]|nr:hypothetical protein [Patescibacteria group bacterium]